MPIWATFMEQVLEGTPSKEMIQPPGVVSTKIDPETGKLAALGQTNAIFEYFRDDNVPTEVAQQDQEDFNTIYNTQQREEPIDELFDDELMRLLEESPTESETTGESSIEALEKQLDEELKQLQNQSEQEEEQEQTTDPGSIF